MELPVKTQRRQKMGVIISQKNFRLNRVKLNSVIFILAFFICFFKGLRFWFDLGLGLELEFEFGLGLSQN